MSQRLSRSILFALIVTLTVGALWMGQGTGMLQARAEDEPLVVPLFDPYAIADVAEQVTPAVVYIEATWPAREQARNPFANDPFFRDFFFPFNPWPDSRPQVQRGTGFIIDEAGYILTNHHVVGNPGGEQTITVKIHTEEFQGEIPAELIGADEQLDLAVLQIERPRQLDRLPTIGLGDSDASRPGEWVVAVGNPYGEQFEHTVTVGVLSAKGREIQIYDNQTRTWKTYRNLMQTDAAINPGNSGGPLINIKGEVIGINTAVNASAQGIGFAIPINTAIAVKEQLIEFGHIKRAFLGISYGDLTERDAALLGLDTASGIIVAEVVPGSAAEKAGLQQYDVVREIGDRPISNSRDLQIAMESFYPGDEVTIVVLRQGNEISLTATLTEVPTEDEDR